MAGWSLPGYTFGSVLGQGGFATVYRAWQVSLGREVAIKVLVASLVAAGDRRRFDRERQILGQLSGHRHIADVHDAGLTGEGHPYLVMRLYPGGTLAQRLHHQGRLPLAEVCDLVGKVAAALDHAHAAGVIHRDVKPANVLLDENGQPALTDFGIAGFSRPAADGGSGSGSVAQSTMTLTYTYAAPEIINGQRGSVASDVYALAATTYELLTGTPAFPVRAAADLLVILNHPPAPITAPGVPPVVSNVVMAGMAKTPQQRPASAGTFATALTQASQIGARLSPAQPAPSRPHTTTNTATEVFASTARPGTRFGAPDYDAPAPPPYGVPPPAPFRWPTGTPHPAVNPTSVSSVILVVVSAVALLFCANIFAIPSLVLGVVALSKNKTDREGGNRLTRIGWILFGVLTALAVLAVIIIIAIAANSDPYSGY